jgi:hypothetical protein
MVILPRIVDTRFEKNKNISTKKGIAPDRGKKQYSVSAFRQVNAGPETPLWLWPVLAARNVE